MCNRRLDQSRQRRGSVRALSRRRPTFDLRLQPGDCAPGQLDRYRELILRDELVDRGLGQAGDSHHCRQSQQDGLCSQDIGCWVLGSRAVSPRKADGGTDGLSSPIVCARAGCECRTCGLGCGFCGHGWLLVRATVLEPQRALITAAGGGPFLGRHADLLVCRLNCLFIGTSPIGGPGRSPLRYTLLNCASESR
jgi:hypothetical protein